MNMDLRPSSDGENAAILVDDGFDRGVVRKHREDRFALAGVPRRRRDLGAFDANASALARVRLKTVTSCPALMRFDAMPAPIWPSPMKPTRMGPHKF